MPRASGREPGPPSPSAPYQRPLSNTRPPAPPELSRNVLRPACGSVGPCSIRSCLSRQTLVASLGQTEGTHIWGHRPWAWGHSPPVCAPLMGRMAGRPLCRQSPRPLSVSSEAAQPWPVSLCSSAQPVGRILSSVEWCCQGEGCGRGKGPLFGMFWNSTELQRGHRR